MPEISRFFGIIVRMFFSDHEPPHFHAVYGEDEALIEIETLASTVAGCRNELWRSSRSGRPCIAPSYGGIGSWLGPGSQWNRSPRLD